MTSLIIPFRKFLGSPRSAVMVVALLLLAGIAPASFAQTFNGGLRGAVTDASGAAVESNQLDVVQGWYRQTHDVVDYLLPVAVDSHARGRL